MSRGISNLGGGGGLTQEEHDALMSIASMPARGDWNAEKQDILPVYRGTVKNGFYVRIPLIGYAKLAFKLDGTDTTYFNGKVNLYFVSDNDTQIETLTKPANRVWSDYLDIPSDAVALEIVGTNADTSLYGFVYASILTADSPYNPDNQTP